LPLLEQGLPIEEMQARFPEVDIPEQLLHLHELGLVAAEGEDQHLRARFQREAMAVEKGELVYALRLNTSTTCNLACEYCYGHPQSRLLPAQHMPLQTAMRALDLYIGLLRQHARKRIQVRFFGGEPLTNWPVVHASLKRLRSLAQEHNLKMGALLNTNATLLTERILDALAEFSDCTRLIISLDGTEDMHNRARPDRQGRGTFTQVMAALKMVQARGFAFSPNLVVSHHNLNQLPQAIDFFHSQGIERVGISPIEMAASGNQSGLIEKVLDALDYAAQQGVQLNSEWMRPVNVLERGADGAYCAGSGSELSVMPNGDIYPCQTQPVRLGNLDDLESRALFKTGAYRRVALRTASNIPACRGCEVEGLCGGGCAGDAYATHGDIYAPAQHCDLIRAFTRRHLERTLAGFDAYRQAQATVMAQSKMELLERQPCQLPCEE
jgi:radical SAM protein with 4Fe4S-binding SPASM domain